MPPGPAAVPPVVPPPAVVDGDGAVDAGVDDEDDVGASVEPVEAVEPVEPVVPGAPDEVVVVVDGAMVVGW